MARQRRTPRTPEARDEAADRQQARALLARLAALLRRIGHPRAAEVDALRADFDAHPTDAWRQLGGNAWWAGAGSLAADAVAAPAAVSPAEGAAALAEFRALLIDLAELLRARGPTNPGLSSWLLAFRNWEASGV
jgi:hypothetical protein